jgi:hypothetical protein
MPNGAYGSVRCIEPCHFRLYQKHLYMLFEAFILTLAREMPMPKLAEIVGENDTRIWRIVAAHVNKAYNEKDFSEVTQVGIDETSSKKCQLIIKQ